MQGMQWIPGGTFRMGDDRGYPEEAPAHTVTVSGFWMDARPVTNAQFADFVQATSYRTVAERPLDPTLIRAPNPNCSNPAPRRSSCQPAARTYVMSLVDGPLCPARIGAIRMGPTARSKSASGTGGAHRIRGYGRIRRVGGQGIADRGRMGVCRTRRTGWRGVLLGGRVHARRPISWPTPGKARFRFGIRRRRVRRPRSGRLVSGQWLRPLRHGRECLGMDERLVFLPASGQGRPPCCMPRNPRGGPKR